MSGRRWTDEDAAQAAADSRREQGLPPTVEDPVALKRVAALLQPEDAAGELAPSSDDEAVA